MKKIASAILPLLVIAATFLAGSWYGQRAPVTPATASPPEIVNHVDATHSAHTSYTPGNAQASEMPPGPAHMHGGMANPGGSSDFVSPGTVDISPEKQQLLGVRVSMVEKAASTHTLRLLGRVTPDEARVYRLNAGIDGFVGEVSAATTGSQVKKDQPLATFAAPDAIAAIQAYILALNAVDRLKQGGGDISTQIDSVTGNPTNSNYQQRLEKLQNLGMSLLQIEEIRRTRQVPPSIRMLAPADGFVLARNISPGQKFDRGAEFYRIADLSRVWILADVFENEAHYLRPGVQAQVSLGSQRKTVPARVAEVLPQFDATARRLKVRLEADNPGVVLRPDMFVDVELPVSLPATIAIPADAILDSGLKKTVFVDRGDGIFEPRQVETGWRFGETVEVVKGLVPGERIVTSGTFLLDSESRMKLAVARIPGTSVTGELAHTGHEHAAHQHGGHQP